LHSGFRSTKEGSNAPDMPRSGRHDPLLNPPWARSWAGPIGRQRLLALALALSAALTVAVTIASGSAHAAACTDEFQAASGESWSKAENWSAGLPTSSSVVCWSAEKTVVVSSGAASAGAIQGGGLQITGGSLTLAAGQASTLAGPLMLTGGGLSGSEGATIALGGDFEWDVPEHGRSTIGGDLSIQQDGAHTFAIIGAGEETLAQAALATEAPVTIGDSRFWGTDSATLATTEALVVAPGIYLDSGHDEIIGSKAPLAITAATVTTSGPTYLAHWSLTLTAGESILSGSLETLALSVRPGATVSVPAGIAVAAEGGVIAGTITGEGSYHVAHYANTNLGPVVVASGGTLSTDSVSVGRGLDVERGATYAAATATNIHEGGLSLDASGSTGDLTITGGTLTGPSGTTLTVSGNFEWDYASEAGFSASGIGGGLTVAQKGIHTFLITGHSGEGTGAEEWLGNGVSLRTESPVTISNNHFVSLGSASLTTTRAVTFAPGNYRQGGEEDPGLLQISAAGLVTSGNTALPDYALVGTGATTSVPSGRTLSAGSFEVQGGVLEDDGVVEAPTTLTGGTLQGVGTIRGPLTNTVGVVAPGDPAGTLTVEGAYAQEFGGRLKSAVDGSGAGESGVLSVDGNVSLAGLLELASSEEFATAARAGAKVALLTYTGQLSGQFELTSVIPALSENRTFAPEYTQPHAVDAVVGTVASMSATTTTSTTTSQGGAQPIGEGVPDAALAGGSIRVGRSGTVTLDISCPSSVTVCEGRVTVRTLRRLGARFGRSGRLASQARRHPSTLRLASAWFKIGGGQREAVKLDLTTKARTLLTREHLLRVRVTIVLRDPAGTRHTTSRIVTLRARA
jgi:hypothetical protein